MSARIIPHPRAVQVDPTDLSPGDGAVAVASSSTELFSGSSRGPLPSVLKRIAEAAALLDGLQAELADIAASTASKIQSPRSRLIPENLLPWQAGRGSSQGLREGRTVQSSLSVSNMSLPEALKTLSERTGYPWTDSLLFELAVAGQIRLHAAPPPDARVTVRHWVKGEGLVVKYRLGWSLAILYPVQTRQVWQVGATDTNHAEGSSAQRDPGDGPEHFLFEPSVQVTRDNLRVRSQSVLDLLKAYERRLEFDWLQRLSDMPQAARGRLSAVHADASKNEQVPYPLAQAATDTAGVPSKPPWWKVDYDILDMARNIGRKLATADRPVPSNRDIAKQIEARINQEERRKATDRPSPSFETIRREALTGWKYRPD